MLNPGMIWTILFGKGSALPNVVEDRQEWLPYEGLTMGTLYIGRQGTGKTTSLARHLVDYFERFQNRAIFVLDWSGSISDAILSLILRTPPDTRESLIKRLIYDDLGNPEWAIPFPEFSEEYGTSFEDQVQRVSVNLAKLQPELVSGAPYLAGLTLREITPQICRMLTSIVNEHDETWQITEAKKLLTDPRLLKLALNQFGYKAPEAKWFLESVFSRWTKNERELKSYAFLALIGIIETKEIRARVGYYRPAWTPQEAIKKGLMVLVDGSRLINRRSAQHYLFTQIYSIIMAEINKRRPGDYNDNPVGLVMDEVYSLLSIPGMAEEIGMLSPLYRSRKLELYVVLQALSQLAPELRKQIWSIGNIVCFGISNFDEAYELAQQLFQYEPQSVKLPARTDTGQPIIETDRGQYLNIANKIQRLSHRQCIIRRYESEKAQDKYVRYIPKTRENPSLQINKALDDLKEFLIKQRGVRVREALEVINQRNLIPTKPPVV